MNPPHYIKRFSESKIRLVQNDLFHIEFDLPTPRPHYIILFNSIKKNSVRDLDENEIRSLLRVIAKFRESTNNNLGDMILSFHTGYWATTKYFHAHICVNVDLYLDHVKNTNFENVAFRPTKKWLIKEEPNKTLKDLYIENVKNSTKTIKTDANKYRLEEINLVKTTQRSLIDLAHLNSDKYDVYFDIKEPNLKFILKNITSDRNNNQVVNISIEDKYVELIQIMVEFAQNYDFFSKQNGCHICVNLKDFASTKQIDGYIKMSGDKFYDMHPLREAFLQCFEINKEYTIRS